VISIAGRTHWLWRAVDQHGIVLDILFQSRRNAKAARRLLRKLLKKQGITPRVLITDKLTSYGAAMRERMRIPIQSGQVFRFEAGQHSGMKPDTVPINYRTLSLL
jgi:transposase-like protein